jgi:hypothetical protein
MAKICGHCEEETIHQPRHRLAKKDRSVSFYHSRFSDASHAAECDAAAHTEFRRVGTHLEFQHPVEWRG